MGIVEGMFVGYRVGGKDGGVVGSSVGIIVGDSEGSDVNVIEGGTDVIGGVCVGMELLDTRILSVEEFPKSSNMLSCSRSSISFETISGKSLTILFPSSFIILILKVSEYRGFD